MVDPNGAALERLASSTAREHPGRRPMEPADPMEMKAAPAEGDPLTMLDCLVEEYARMGFGKDDILKLFDRPFYRATNGLRHLLGEEAVRGRVEAVLARCGVFRVTIASEENDEPADVLNIEAAS